MSETNRGIDELKTAGLFDEDSDYNGMIGESVKELLEVFGKQGHSGASAPRVAEIFHRLVKGETLTPLKGTPDEWVDHGGEGGTRFQNNRNSAVFADSDTGKNATYLYGKAFVSKNGGTWTHGGSSVPIKFPCFAPKTVYIRDSFWGRLMYKIFGITHR